MENKKIIMLKHHVLNVYYDNSFYTNQLDSGDRIEDYVVIDVTSRMTRNKEFMAEHPNFAKEISPFYIGPVVSSDGVKANIFEVFWQCGKVYPCHDDNGHPNKAYFEWRNSFYAKTKCTKDLMRHACHDLGYENKDALYFAYYDKEKQEYVPLNYVQARKKVFVPEYAKLVANSESFRYLKSIVDSGKKLALVDFDAYNYYSRNAMRKAFEAYVNKLEKNNLRSKKTVWDFFRIDSMKKVMDCSYLTMGHGFVLKALLQGDLKVENGQVVDVSHILD